MLTVFWIDLFNTDTTAIRAKRIGLLWIKGNLVHSGHLDFVRGRQATVVIRVSELLGGSTLALGYAIAIETQRLLVQRLLYWGILDAAPPENVNIQNACNSKISACKHHTVNSWLCQRRVFQTSFMVDRKTWPLHALIMLRNGKLHHTHASHLPHTQTLRRKIFSLVSTA